MTNFNPELVTRVGQAILNAAFASAFETHKTVVDQRAIAALEASGIAELTEALREARAALHQHYVDWDGEPEDVVPLQLARAKCDAALAKIGGNHA